MRAKPQTLSYLGKIIYWHAEIQLEAYTLGTKKSRQAPVVVNQNSISDYCSFRLQHKYSAQGPFASLESCCSLTRCSKKTGEAWMVSYWHGLPIRMATVRLVLRVLEPYCWFKSSIFWRWGDSATHRLRLGLLKISVIEWAGQWIGIIWLMTDKGVYDVIPQMPSAILCYSRTIVLGLWPGSCRFQWWRQTKVRRDHMFSWNSTLLLITRII